VLELFDFIEIYYKLAFFAIAWGYFGISLLDLGLISLIGASSIIGVD